jgi:hypothetical protein
LDISARRSLRLGEEPADGFREHARFVFDLLPGETRNSPARDLKALLSAAVVDEGNVGVMEATTVGFEDQSLGSPEEVRLKMPAADFERHVHLGLRQPNLEAHVQEHPLKLAPAPLRLRMDFIEKRPESGHAAPPSSSIDLPSQLLVID